MIFATSNWDCSCVCMAWCKRLFLICHNICIWTLFGWSTEKQNEHELFCATHYRNVGNLLETVTASRSITVRFPASHRFFLFSKLLWPNPFSYSIGNQGLKRPDHEADRSNPSSAKVKNEWNPTYTQCTLQVCMETTWLIQVVSTSTVRQHIVYFYTFSIRGWLWTQYQHCITAALPVQKCHNILPRSNSNSVEQYFLKTVTQLAKVFPNMY